MRLEPVLIKVPHGSRRTEALCGVFAGLHREGAPNDVLSKIGASFLKDLFYPGLLGSSQAVVYEALEGEEPVGFVAAALDMKHCLRQIVLSRPLLSVWHGFSSVLLRPGMWKSFIEALSIEAPGQSRGAAEIIMITVAAAYQGQGLGTVLLSKLNSELKKRGVQACLARVREDNLHALRMYGKAGYHEIGSVDFNGGKWRWLECRITGI